MKRSYAQITVLCLLLIVSRSQLTSQWTKTSFPASVGRSIRSMIVRGGNLYVGRQGQLFVSSDLGTTWRTMDSGLANLYVLSLSIRNENTLH